MGLALTYITSLIGMLQYCVRQSAEVENVVSIFSVLECSYIIIIIKLTINFVMTTDGVCREAHAVQ